VRLTSRHVVVAGLGVLFGIGLTLGGMTDPARIIAFLDFAGRWDPSLLFVMGGASGAYMLGYRAVLRTRGPWYGGSYPARPSRAWREPRLLVGAALFGIGWGLGGYCPGPAWTAAGAGRVKALVVLVTMLAGIVVADRWARGRDREGA